MGVLYKERETILSAGIDVGTSTTKVIISRFVLMNTAGSSHIPRIEIISKEIVHKSPIFRTPLKDSLTIDTAGVEEIIHSQYHEAGVSPADIKTGAIIITGETATKKNAREMLHYLSGEAGDFLVATAGPDLEGIIAAKGSGAYQYSLKSGRVTANIDIGGGTANISVFKREKLLGTCTMHIGGRLIESNKGTITSISPPIRQLIEQEGWSLKEGESADHPHVEEVTRFMAASIARILKNEPSSKDNALILGHQPNWKVPIEAVMFSGGVAECMYKREVLGTSAVYSDIGMDLANALQENNSLLEWEWIKPEETVRATVLGAGMQTTEISGATIQVMPDDLPVKNVPVYKFSFAEGFEERLAQLEPSVKEAIDLYDSFQEGQNFILYLADLPYMRFRNIQSLAKEILKVMKLRPDPTQAILLGLQTDHAKVLGQTLRAINAEQSVICIDQINVDHGDYLDIGCALQSEVVPVVVKTLKFHSL